MVIIINVIYIIMFVRAVRECWVRIFNVMWQSSSVFMIILIYLVLWSYIGYILFSNKDSNNSDLNGQFLDLPRSFATMAILFTVSNYPDV